MNSNITTLSGTNEKVKNEEEITEFLNLIINKLSTAVFAITANGSVIYKNDKLDSYTSYPSFGNNSSFIHDYFPLDVKEKITQLIDTTFSYGYSEGEFSITFSNQRKKKFLIAMNRVIHNRIPYGVAELQDISIRAKSEEELTNAMSNLQELTKELERENTYLKEEILETTEPNEVVTQNNEMKTILHSIKQVALTDAPVYILGEYGTGKEMIGRAVHQLSHRNNKPFVKINCDTPFPELLEQQLLGHKDILLPQKGKVGKLEIANGGTVYLSHINKLTPQQQIELLQALRKLEMPAEYREQRYSKLDIRLIVSSTEPLVRLVENNQFSEDLFYKLCIFPLHLPPLRSRRDDIPLLVNHFTAACNKKYNFRISRIPNKLLDELMLYEWPGNVSELKSQVEQAVISSKGNKLEFRERLAPIRKITKTIQGFSSWEEYERNYLKEVLRFTNWRIRGKSGAAVLLDLKPTTLESKMKRLGITKPN